VSKSIIEEAADEIPGRTPPYPPVSAGFSPGQSLSS
jgi:hypothetical protein